MTERKTGTDLFSEIDLKNTDRSHSRFLGAGQSYLMVAYLVLAALFWSTGLRAEPIEYVPLPQKRPAAMPGQILKRVETPEQWSDLVIEKARKKCAAILIEANAEFKMLDPIRKGACGTPAPVKLSALGTPVRVKISPPATINCNMVRVLNKWLNTRVQPLAKEQFGAHVIKLRNISGYSCRHRYNNPRKKLSEHALANALDIAGLKLSNGNYISLLKHWGETVRDRQRMIANAKAKAALNEAIEAARLADERAAARSETDARPGKRKAVNARNTFETTVQIEIPEPQPLDDRARFLRQLHIDACGLFGTVLGPEANRAHANHYHFDLAPRRRSAYCE